VLLSASAVSGSLVKSAEWRQGGPLRSLCAVLTVRAGSSRERSDALKVWRSANEARGLAPTSARIARVEQKLAEPTAYLVVACDDEGVVGMALAEPYRAQDGCGPVMTDRGHVSMVFVAPKRWGCGIGRELLDALHRAMRERGYNAASLWTRASNGHARRLYEGRGYQLTADVKQLPGGDEIVRYEIALSGSPGQSMPHEPAGL